ncbi:SET domain-containing protein [Aspergillus affinis]|uniref:SET domain-containing protein n=1 Tax=Aspergillus affinis TaxID=1070780 RepID=UPI0022FF00AB|nr:uncharacterized protein KD926_011346 [Aspergillus affinis]KAI9038008.1 hypothetical protein KD926_011346 [Aspergillus affinis]
MDSAPASYSSTHPPPKENAPTRKKHLPLRRRCKAPCTCPLRTMPSNPETEFEHFLNRNRQVCVPTFEGDIEKGPSMNNTGMGLIAKKAIPSGSVVFSEKVLSMGPDDLTATRDAKDIEGVLHQLAKNMGSEWYSKFLELGAGYEPSEDDNEDTMIGERPGGVGAYIWHKHHMSAKSNDLHAGFIGLKLAWLNHSCLSNCTMTLVKRYPYRGSARAAVEKEGEFLMPQEPVVTCVVVKALKDIAEDEELTISYFRIRGPRETRLMTTLIHGQFSCACYWCSHSHPASLFERTYELQQDVDILMSCPRIIKHRPALLYQAVHDLVVNLSLIRNRDAYIAQVWAHCAVVAGFHSDIARATAFLDKAIEIIRALRPAQDTFRGWYTRWRHHLQEMPGYGTSSRGLSTEDQGVSLSENCEILFMGAANPEEYLRVGQYHRLTDTMKARIGPRVGDATFFVGPDEEFDETREDHDWEAFPDTYLRSRETAVATKRNERTLKVLKLLEKDFKDPFKDPENCRKFEEELNLLYLTLKEDHPLLVSERLKGDDTGAMSKSHMDEVSDTGSVATVTPYTYNQERKKQKKKKKSKGKKESEKAPIETDETQGN